MRLCVCLPEPEPCSSRLLSQGKIIWAKLWNASGRSIRVLRRWQESIERRDGWPLAAAPTFRRQIFGPPDTAWVLVAKWSAGVHVTDSAVEIQDRNLKLTNLEKVLYPATGFTKKDVIDYYVRIAPAIIPHLAGRALTRKRYPDGVEGE